MALADIDVLMIRASYTDQPMESRYRGGVMLAGDRGHAGRAVGTSCLALQAR